MFKRLLNENDKINEIMKNEVRILLIGNPNVGKSTVFNALTGLKQHTGNWAGKTVEMSSGTYDYTKKCYRVIDLPGTYSLYTNSKEEAISKAILDKHKDDICIIVCDSTCLKRNLSLVLQVIENVNHVILCMNLMDEAKLKGIEIKEDKLIECLGIPVVCISAKNKKDIDYLKKAISEYELNHERKMVNKSISEIDEMCVVYHSSEYEKKVLKWDRILTSKIGGSFIFLCLLFFIFWLTITGSNVPSHMLSEFFDYIGIYLNDILNSFGVSVFMKGLILDGIYKTLTNVISVMLPPMLIFFPLFTLLEECGYLPRIAFLMDHLFEKVCACGKQSITMCMSFGCNCVGISGSRIMNNEKERLLSILTNNFIPCNGRFPLIIVLISIFLSGNGFMKSFYLMLFILTGVLMSFVTSYILSKTILKHMPVSFTLELSSFRKPSIKKVIVESIRDRCLYVLIRAVCAAIPAGAIIYLLGNVVVYNQSLFIWISSFLEPLGKSLGMDGVIILAFLLAFPANELVLPIILMIYSSTSVYNDVTNLMNIKEILVNNGWTVTTAVCVIIFSIMHYPCFSSLMCIKREVSELKWVILSFLIPTFCGVFICFMINLIAG